MSALKSFHLNYILDTRSVASVGSNFYNSEITAKQGIPITETKKEFVRNAYKIEMAFILHHSLLDDLLEDAKNDVDTNALQSWIRQVERDPSYDDKLFIAIADKLFEDRIDEFVSKSFQEQFSRISFNTFIFENIFTEVLQEAIDIFKMNTFYESKRQNIKALTLKPGLMKDHAAVKAGRKLGCKVESLKVQEISFGDERFSLSDDGDTLYVPVPFQFKGHDNAFDGHPRRTELREANVIKLTALGGTIWWGTTCVEEGQTSYIKTKNLFGDVHVLEKPAPVTPPTSDDTSSEEGGDDSGSN